MPVNPMFIHSKCCNAHWELVFEDGQFSLQCEKCGKSAGKEFKITGPNLTGCECDVCKKNRIADSN